MKDAEVCAVGELEDRSLDVDPATKGVAHAFAYLVSPKGSNPEAEKALLARQPTVDLRPEKLRVPALQPGHARSSDHHLQVERPRRP